MKANGARLADGLRLSVGADGYGGGPLRVRADHGRLRGDVWSVVDVAAPDGYVGCVAQSGDEPCAVHLRGPTRFIGDQLSEARRLVPGRRRHIGAEICSLEREDPR